MRRLRMRVFSSLIGIFVGLIVSAALLSRFSVTLTALVVATLVFWVVHIVAELLALRVFFRDPSFLMLLVVSLGQRSSRCSSSSCSYRGCPSTAQPRTWRRR